MIKYIWMLTSRSCFCYGEISATGRFRDGKSRVGGEQIRRVRISDSKCINRL